MGMLREYDEDPFTVLPRRTKPARSGAQTADRAAAQYLYLVAKRYAEGDRRTDARDVEQAYREWFAAVRE